MRLIRRNVKKHEPNITRKIRYTKQLKIKRGERLLLTHCPILGKKLEIGTRYTYSLDKKDPNKGYTKDNVWVISGIANAMKWDSSAEERVLFANWVLSLEGGELP